MNETGETALLPENYSDKVFAILLGLADGATHARDDIDPGATEILPLYLADGLLEALEWANDGVASDEAACMWLAALRGYNKITGSFPDRAPEPLGRWIDKEFAHVEIFERSRTAIRRTSPAWTAPTWDSQDAPPAPAPTPPVCCRAQQ